MKRAGRGFVYNGIATLSMGDLEIRCISCPHPDEYLQEGWIQYQLLRSMFHLSTREPQLIQVQIYVQADSGWRHMFSPEKHQEVYA